MTLPRLLALAILTLLPTVATAAEPWADKRLTVLDGLQLWLDGQRAFGRQPPPADHKIAQWHDASGRGRNLAQPVADARPTRLIVAGVGVARFDGTDDHLRAVKQATNLDAFSVFLVAVPRKNPSSFLGMLAFNAAGQKDYQSGLNIDFGPTATPRFSVLNVEGAGFGGARNLRTAAGAFGELVTLELTADAKTLRLAVNGQAEGQRPRAGGRVSLDEITVGARFYNNAPGQQVAAGFSRCDIAEVLVYDRVLTADELKAVRSYLATKYAALKESVPADSETQGEALVPVKNPPAVQTFVPGFTARELPVNLTNINNVKYRPDGTLVAVGYDGNIWLLRDTDGDGLEDKATPFFENKKTLKSPIGMDLTPPNYKYGQGVFVAAEGKCLLITDTDGDGKADKEVVVADGWKDKSVNIDAIGVVVDPRDGSVYFGRGTANYANAYLLDKDGNARYSLTDERGTIQKVSPDFKTRETYATGTRMSVAMRFNAAGDLFISDQEGATWLPNGNPLDELLHVQKGRHYGFPPRHPKHLPNVIDEPSTFDYGPQHQSTCGICFNDPVTPGGPTFGPKAWAGDLFVTGESRGKLWRTKLVKTPAGYVAKTDLFASLNMLTMDVCLSPAGDLVVCCHSGGPDWGSGPTGKGKLFKISYTGRDLPQPVLAWPSGPNEVRVEFDRPVEPGQLQDVVRRTKVTAGPHVRAGDRFESLWPGYAVVQAEKTAPRFDVPVRSAQLTPDRRSLVLATDPHTAAVHYAVTLPGLGRTAGKDGQHAEVDLGFDLSGWEATWTVGDKVAWTGWLPSLDLNGAKQLTRGSATHDALWAAMKEKGTLRLKAKLNLTDMLRPAVQPGSRLDHQFPPERVTLQYPARGAVKVVGEGDTGYVIGGLKKEVGLVLIEPNIGRPTLIEVTIPNFVLTEQDSFSISFFTAEDERPRPFQLHRALVPWADTSAKALEPAPPKPAAELAGGSWARGRKVFFSEQAACAKCHTVHGRGETIGPDLSNLIHRDYASVLRDIEKPSFAINPDHLTYTVNLTDGRSLTGVVQTVGDRLRIADAKGVITEVPAAAVESRKASAVSTMPEELPKLLGPERMKDLLTFLLTSPVSMPRDYPGQRPKPRTVAEVNAALAGAPTPPGKTRPVRVVLVAGPKDHGPGEHDYPAWQKAWAELLAAADNTEVVTAWEWPAKDEFAKADVMVFNHQGDWNAKRAADVDAFLERGGGLVYVHWALEGRKDGPGFATRIGLASPGGTKFRHGEVSLAVNKEAKHPVLRNFDKLDLIDETYWKLVGDLKPDRVLATAIEEKAAWPQVWSLEPGKGRVFVSIPGHYSHTFDDPLFRVLLLRGIAWSAKEPVDRFNELVWPGANVAR
jgi:putative heme-binding domain-containing protein